MTHIPARIPCGKDGLAGTAERMVGCIAQQRELDRQNGICRCTYDRIGVWSRTNEGSHLANQRQEMNNAIIC